MTVTVGLSDVRVLNVQNLEAPQLGYDDFVLFFDVLC